MKRICRYLTNTLSLSENAYELMYYGMFVVVTNLLSILSIMIIGYLLDELKNTIVFMHNMKKSLLG